MKIGYIRVSTKEQVHDRQIDGLRLLCDRLHIETVSAVAERRPVFDELLASLAPGDTLVVASLDRAFRSTVDALTQAEALRSRGVHFQIVNLGVDTSTADGKLIFTVIAAFAEHERNRLSERTKEGLVAARRRGVRLGRPYKLTKSQVKGAAAQCGSGRKSLSTLARKLGVHSSTLRRNFKRL
ncbi:hypothetical protein B7H23_07665 [Notoacmeibacter marinus]|uniref:Resolvase/invertase-type recombinase catalytic domain-containing protein n=1 Tax=Notoacmeibacter marinus TaxID=1876515 RepID=A0A231V3Z6_9HYPH|nr:recombinase family protein [Notoacmeibacter marinus]OXT02741.1 hypothetical protein B7H23_07665 [Notoacmeibacter marinus]